MLVGVNALARIVFPWLCLTPVRYQRLAKRTSRVLVVLMLSRWKAEQVYDRAEAIAWQRLCG